MLRAPNFDTKRQKRFAPQARRSNGDDGITFVRCRICGDHRRVISGRHLSKHGIDRESYMEEYRLSPDQLIAKECRVIQSSRKGYQPHGKKDWFAALKKIHKTDGNVFAGHLQDHYPHLYTQGVWIFGNWNKALKSAGFDPEKMRLRVQWDEDKIISKIQTIHKKQQPLYAKYVMKNHPSLCSAALREFGSWPKALVAAGVTKKPRTKKLFKDPLSLLNALSEALHGDSGNELTEAIKNEAAHYYGSVKKAIAALEKQEKLLPGWNKRKVIALLSRMHESKQNLAYGSVRRDNMGLLSAAEKHFGSWGKALHAAGIDPNLYFVHHKWRGPRGKKR